VEGEGEGQAGRPASHFLCQLSGVPLPKKG